MEDIMYRSEETGGSGVRDIIEVMTFEIYELGNTDILDYVCEHYLKPGTRKIVQEFIYKVETGTEDIIEDDVIDICEIIIKEINEVTNHNLKYALWLADYDTVMEIYSYDESTIEAYKISDIILSDLGKDGILFGYDEEPEPIYE